MAGSESQRGIPPFKTRLSLRRLLAWGGFLTVAVLPLRAQEARFSQSLAPADEAATGILKLSADQRAVLDALVRRDARINAVPDPGQPAPAPRFSQRLLAAERQGAGLTLLTDAESAKLDAAVARFESRGGSGEQLVTSSEDWRPAAGGPALEVHGTVSLTVGAGRGGASFMGGAMAVSVADPAHGIVLSAGYAEMHGKGPLLGGRGFCGGFPDEYPFGPGSWWLP